MKCLFVNMKRLFIKKNLILEKDHFFQSKRIKLLKNIFCLFSFAFFAGCLKTRNETKPVEDRAVMQQQVVTLQKTHADSGNRVSELEEQVRFLNGKVEELENSLKQKSQNQNNQTQESDLEKKELQEKVRTLQEALLRLEGQWSQFANQMQEKENQAKENQIKSSESTGKGKEKDGSSFEEAQELFKKKDWKKAILKFQKYRDESPKGKLASEATYKIGVCFHELGMKEEAKAFWEEVVAKYPQSEMAKKSQYRLKNVK